MRYGGKAPCMVACNITALDCLGNLLLDNPKLCKNKRAQVLIKKTGQTAKQAFFQ